MISRLLIRIAGCLAMSTKVCVQCKVQKSAEDFYGKHVECKECDKARARKYRQEHPEKVRETRARSNAKHAQRNKERAAKWKRDNPEKAQASWDKWYSANRGHVISSVQSWRKTFPERRAAHVAVDLAIKRGDIAPWPCMICGGEAEAHHPDYSMPLDVVWLCHAHHRQTHEMVKYATT